MKILFAGPDPELLMSNTGEDRKEGLHLSDILVRMAWEKDKKYRPDAPKDLMVFEQGFTWESILERALAHRHANRAGSRPDQIQEDGIWLSPDWIGPDGHEEWKATKKSINSAEQKVHEWLPQAQCYVRALLRRGLIQKAITTFRVWFINGDYTYESKNSDRTLLRDYQRIVIEFSKRELDERWSGVLSFARRHGLLKDNKPWDNRPSLERRLRERQERSRKWDITKTGSLTGSDSTTASLGLHRVMDSTHSDTTPSRETRRWHSREARKPATMASVKNANGSPRKPSPRQGQVVTFPSSKVKASRRGAV